MSGMGENRVRAFTAAVWEMAPAAERLRFGETDLAWRGRGTAVQIWVGMAAGWMVRVLAGRPTYSPEQFIEALRECALRAGWEAREQYPLGVSEHHGWFAGREKAFWEAVFGLARALEVPPVRIAGEG